MQPPPHNNPRNFQDGQTTTLEDLNARGQGFLPGLIGIEFLTVEPG
jgi:hypothetical protein